MTLPSKLYKYESWNEHSLANLKNQQLFFSDPRSFNDPFDCAIDFILAELSDEDVDSLHAHYLNICPDKNGFIREFGNKANETFKSNIEAIWKGTFRESLDDNFCKIGVSCFSEKHDHILMWSHYAKSHTGFCLEFDTSYEPLNKAMQVKYSKDFPVVNPALALTSHFETVKMALTKHKNWKYEKEWRCFHHEKNKLFGYPAEALTGVYFGAKIDFAHLEIIALIIQGQNPQVKLYQGKKSATQFKVDFDEFQYTPHIEAKRRGLA